MQPIVAAATARLAWSFKGKGKGKVKGVGREEGVGWVRGARGALRVGGWFMRVRWIGSLQSAGESVDGCAGFGLGAGFGRLG